MPPMRATPLCLSAFWSVLCLLQPAVAQEIDWGKDYATALRQAQETKRPLFLDFGTVDCFYCKKLDDSTFRDPAVIARLNRDFVAVKIDAARYASLVQQLHIQFFPTLLVATPGGKILNTQTGFLGPEAFLTFLSRSLAAGERPGTLTSRSKVQPDEAAPGWMAEDYGKAARAIGRSEFASAVPLLKNILKEDRKYPIQQQAASLLKELEDQAAAGLAHVKELEDAGRAVEALQANEELIRKYDGTAAAAEGMSLLSSLNARLDGRTRERRQEAAELLRLAEKELQMQQYLMCLVRCQSIVRNYANLPEATAAAELAAKIKSNPEWMQQVCDGGAEVVGMSFLTLAETRLKEGRPQQAMYLLERVVQAFPNTRHAEQAQARLSQIQGPPALPVSDEEKHQ
jgi:thioredoxin-related protein